MERKKNKKKVYTFYAEPSLIERLGKLAEKKRRSRTWMTREILEKGIAELENDEKKYVTNEEGK
jgi:predicted DNA-binding protein